MHASALLALLAPVALAAPRAMHSARSIQVMDAATAAEQTVPYTLTNFGAFVAAPGSNASSFVSFHFADANDGRPLETDCVVAAPANSSVYGKEFWCDRAHYPATDVHFTLAEGWLQIERGFQSDAATYITAISNQTVCWDGSDRCGTSTSSPAGTYYSYPGVWQFTITEEVA